MDWPRFLLEHLPLICAAGLVLTILLCLLWRQVYDLGFRAGRATGVRQGYRLGQRDERSSVQRDDPVSYPTIIETRLDGSKVRHQL